MRHPTRRHLIVGAAAALATGAVRAQSSGPLRILVGYSAGGGVDAMARLLATGLGSVLGQQVIVENRAGASGMIAAEVVSKAAADGQTLLLRSRRGAQLTKAGFAFQRHAELMVQSWEQGRKAVGLPKGFTDTVMWFWCASTK